MTTPLDAGHPPVIIAAQAVSDVLRRVDVNLSFALCGEVACSIYRGLGAAPLQLDVMMLSPSTELEPLHHAIVQTDPAHFSFCQSRDSGSLCFRNTNDTTLSSHDSHLHIPMNIMVSDGSHPPGRLCDVGGFPLVPFSFLILRKLEQWDVASQQEEQEHRRRDLSLVIARDIRGMLKLLRIRDLHRSQPPFDARLHKLSRDRVVRFFTIHSNFKKEWRQIGFGTSSERTDSQKTKRSKRRKQRSVVSAELGGSPSLSTPNNIPDAPMGPHAGEGQSSKPDNTSTAVPSVPAVAATAESTAAPSGSSVTRVKKAKEPRMSFTRIRHLAAQAAAKTLHELGFSCAIFGSFACKLYGNNRIPNDVDILVLPPPESTHNQEDIKEAIVSADPDHFVLKAARDPDATYRVLYFCLSASPTASTARYRSSKVDILLPGVMHLPALPASLIVWKNELPIVPFSVLILQKLQGWDDHRNAVEERYTEKAPADAKDLAWLIGGGGGRNAAVLRELKQRRPWSDRTLFSEEFERLSRERVISFCEVSPQHINIFRSLGFATVRDLDGDLCSPPILSSS